MHVDMQCPLCNTSGSVEIPTTIIENNPRGIVSINIPCDLICKHNFQLFLDRKGSVRGYQKTDFQPWSSNAGQETVSCQKQTQFACKLCNSVIKFYPDDKSSYLSRRDHELYFGMKLATYQVAHMFGNEMHLNTVIIDENGNFQGQLEGYPVPLSEFLTGGAIPARNLGYNIIPEDGAIVYTHKFLEVVFLLNTETFQVFGLVCPKSLNLEEIARITCEKFQEMEKVYRNMSGSAAINIADKTYRIWIFGKTILAATFADELFFDRFDQIARQLVRQPFDWLSVRTDQVRTALKFLERPQGSQNETGTFLRLVTDDRLFSRIRVKYPENITRILPRLTQEFGITGEILEPILLGQKSLNEQFGSAFITQATELLEVIDFIDRRKLFA